MGDGKARGCESEARGLAPHGTVYNAKYGCSDGWTSRGNAHKGKGRATARSVGPQSGRSPEVLPGLPGCESKEQEDKRSDLWVPT